MLCYKLLSISRWKKIIFVLPVEKNWSCLRMWAKLYGIWYSELGCSNFKSAEFKKKKTKPKTFTKITFKKLSLFSGILKSKNIRITWTPLLKFSRISFWHLIGLFTVQKVCMKLLLIWGERLQECLTKSC